MKEELTAQKQRKNAVVKLVPAELLARRREEINRMIAQRAYQLFEGRGCLHGHDVADWLQAEDEVVHSCRHDLRESTEAIILHAEMPSSYPAEQLYVSVEPRRLCVSGEREVEVGYWDGAKTRTEARPQRIFRVHDLPVEVNPSMSTAVLSGNMLEVIMPKAETAKKPETRSASSSG
jgi:HSP20 family molecular chaperone IbpA